MNIIYIKLKSQTCKFSTILPIGPNVLLFSYSKLLKISLSTRNIIVKYCKLTRLFNNICVTVFISDCVQTIDKIHL